jgi:hypothetical protein
MKAGAERPKHVESSDVNYSEGVAYVWNWYAPPDSRVRYFIGRNY